MVAGHLENMYEVYNIIEMNVKSKLKIFIKWFKDLLIYKKFVCWKRNFHRPEVNLDDDNYRYSCEDCYLKFDDEVIEHGISAATNKVIPYR